jgi:hypothetical protein
MIECHVNIVTHLVMSQSLDVEQSSAYCFAITIGARQTLAPPAAEISQTFKVEFQLDLFHLNIEKILSKKNIILTKPDSQSASRRHNSPSFLP